MKKFLILLALSTILLAGCANTGSNTIGATTIGAGTGALVGQVAGKNTKSTLIGAGIGAAAGALVGATQDQTQVIKENNQQQLYYQTQQTQYNTATSVQPAYSKPYVSPSY